MAAIVRAVVLSVMLLGGVVAPPALARCTGELASQQRATQDNYARIVASIDRSRAKQAAQDSRIDALPADLRDTLPASAPVPSTEVDGFDPLGAFRLDCSDAAAAEATLGTVETDLVALARAAVDFRTAVDAREEALVAAEAQAAERGATVAEEAAPEMEAVPEAREPETADGGATTGDAVMEAVPETWREPLRAQDNPQLFQRVLTLPDSRLASTAGGTAEGDALPAFSVLYVFAREEVAGRGWVEVGRGFAEPPLGWLEADKTAAWNSMLVMQFAPRGLRERVLFFENREDLADIITSPFFAEDAAGLFEAIATGSPDERFIAIEPGAAVDYADRPYLLPILDWKGERFDDGTETTLVKVASVTLTTSSRQARDERSFEETVEPTPEVLSDFRIGVVFVMDTTVSMGPYIRRTYQTVESFYDAFAGAGVGDAVAFGLVGYRDNLDHDPRLEYVVRVFQPLDPAATAPQVLANLRTVVPARVPTVGWDEDAFAGLAMALQRTDWDPFDARFVILVTDAGARSGTDPLAFVPGADARTVQEAARQRGVAVIPIHLLTPEAARAGNIERARQQYQVLSVTGDIADAKYLPLDATSDARFAQEVSLMAQSIAAAAAGVLEGELAKAQAAAEQGATEAPPPANGTADAPVGRLADIVTNEIFRAQLEYLGRQTGTDAPSFVEGWAADLDITDPDIAAMEVSVFLTRNQLNALAESIALITDGFKAAETSPEAFFEQLQMLAARTASDPDAVRSDETAAIREILPDFLEALPYRSAILRLNRDYWASLSTASRQGFIEELERKLKIYDELYAQTRNWYDFGAGDPALEAYPVRLSLLP